MQSDRSGLLCKVGAKAKGNIVFFLDFRTVQQHKSLYKGDFEQGNYHCIGKKNGRV